jgi:hypothetical protein
VGAPRNPHEHLGGTCEEPCNRRALGSSLRLPGPGNPHEDWERACQRSFARGGFDRTVQMRVRRLPHGFPGARANVAGTCRRHPVRPSLSDMASEVIGRDDEVERLRTFLAAPALERPRTLVLEGEAGIGKTTVRVAGVELARERGLCVLSSGPAEAEQAFAFRGPRRPPRRRPG